MTGLIAEAAAGFFYGNREYSDLPRKHKITIAACPFQCNAPEINCVALVATLKTDARASRYGSAAGNRRRPRLSRHLGVFVPRAEAMPVLRAIIDVWRLTTEYRISRVKARLKFMIDDYGVEAFRELVEARLGRALEDLAATAARRTPKAITWASTSRSSRGCCYVGFPVYLGMMSGRQMRALADVAADFGGDIRLTRRQNFILTGIPARAARRESSSGSARSAFRSMPTGSTRSSIGCIGDPHCNYAVTPTKEKLATIIERLVDAVWRRGSGPEAESRRLPACLRAALDRRYRLAGHDRPRTATASRSKPSTSSCAAGSAATPRSASRCCGGCPRPKVEDTVARPVRRLPRAAAGGRDRSRSFACARPTPHSIAIGSARRRQSRAGAA